MTTPPVVQRIRNYLDNRPDVRRIAANTGWLFSDRIIRLTFALLVSSWVARTLGAEQYGYLSLGLAYLALAQPLLKIGMDQIIIRYLVESPEMREGLLGTAFALRVAMSLIVLPLVVVVAVQLHPDNALIAALTGLLAVGTMLEAFEVIDFWFQSQVASRYTVWARNLTFALTTVGKVVAILAQAPLIIFGFLYMLDTAMYIIALVMAYHRSGGQVRRWRWRTPLAGQLLIKSWPLILSGIAVSLYMRVDQVMLAQLLPGAEGEAAVGIYSAAVRLSEAWYFVPTAILSSVFPAILQTKQVDEELYRRRIQRLFNLMVLIAYVFALPITFLSPLIIDLLFGPDYAAAAPQLAVLVWAGVWVALGISRTAVLHAEDAIALSAWATGLGAVINIALNFVLIPSYGGLGCAIATLVSQICAAHITTFLLPRVRHIAWYQTLALIWPNPLPARPSKES